MRFFKLICTLIFAFIIVVIGAVFVMPKERLAKEALKRAEAQIGRVITVNGSVDLGFFPNLYVRMENLSIANADWSNMGPMVQARELRVGVALIPALSGKVQVTELRLDQPHVILEKSSSGLVNWDFAATVRSPDDQATAEAKATGDVVKADAPDVANPTGGMPSISLPRAVIQGGKFEYRDHQSDAIMLLSNVDLTLQMPSIDSAMTAEGSFVLSKEQISYDVKLANLSQILQSEKTNASVNIDAKGGTVTFDGNVSTGPELDGHLLMNIADTSGFASAFGVSVAQLPTNLGASVKGATQISVTSDRVSLGDMQFGLGANAISGTASIALGGKPKVSGTLNFGDFDLRSGPVASGSKSTSNGGTASSSEHTSEPSSTGWSKAKIDASALNAVDANVNFSAVAVRTDTVSLGQISGAISVENGRLVADINRMDAYSGQAQGQAVVNARSGLSMSAKLKGASFEVQGLLGDLIGQDKFQGKTDFSVDLLASGGSVDALIRSLSGAGQLAIQSGRWTGIDLDKILRSGQVEKGTTVFDDMSASFNIAGGVVDNRDLKFTLPNFETTGRGQVDLGNRSLDYTISPKATKARGGEGISVPLRIQGSWDKPKLTPDMQAVIDQNLAKEKAELEAKTKEKIEAEKKKLEAKVKEKLGVSSQDGQSVEDAVRQKIEEEAKKGLLNLLGKK